MSPSLLALREELHLDEVDPEEAWAYIENYPYEEHVVAPSAGLCQLRDPVIDRPAFDIPDAWWELLASDSTLAEAARNQFEAIYEALEPVPKSSPRRRVAMRGRVDLDYVLGDNRVA
jgi:hypothetical protein